MPRRLIKGIQRSRRIRQLREKVSSAPSPRAYSLLCEWILASRGPEDAQRVATEAIECFPWSERLQVLFHRIRRAAFKEEIERLENRVQQAPTAELYGRLAEVYKLANEDDEVFRICRECISRFPKSDSAFLVEGRLRLERFFRNHLKHDGVIAAEKLERAVALNPLNMKARRELSELYFEIGAWNRLQRHMRPLLRDTNTDERIQEMARFVDRIGTTEEEDLPALFRASQVRHATASSENGLAKKDPPLREMMATLRTLPGVTKVKLVQASDDAEDRSTLGPEDHGGTMIEAGAIIGATAQHALVEMEMGNLRHGQLSGSWGHLLVFRFATGTLIVVTAANADPDEIREYALSARSSKVMQ